MSKPDYYEVLGVSRSASVKEVLAAYRRLAKKHHPDHNPNDKEAAAKRFKLCTEARDVLVDQEKRSCYDAELEKHDRERQREEQKRRQERETQRQQEEQWKREKERTQKEEQIWEDSVETWVWEERGSRENNGRQEEEQKQEQIRKQKEERKQAIWNFVFDHQWAAIPIAIPVMAWLVVTFATDATFGLSNNRTDKIGLEIIALILSTTYCYYISCYVASCFGIYWNDNPTTGDKATGCVHGCGLCVLACLVLLFAGWMGWIGN